MKWRASFKLRADWSAAAVTTKRRRNAVTLGKEGHKTNMDFPTICKKFYYCLYKTTLYVKVILLKACFKYEKAYMKNCFFKDFTGRVHLHLSLIAATCVGPLPVTASGSWLRRRPCLMEFPRVTAFLLRFVVTVAADQSARSLNEAQQLPMTV